MKSSQRKAADKRRSTARSSPGPPPAASSSSASPGGGSESESHRSDSGARDEAESFGTWLRRQRELREIDLRDIADASKVSLRYFQAFEEDRLEVLPAPVFAKGFLRQYASYVGLDPEEVVNFFLVACQAEEGTEASIEESAKASRAGIPWAQMGAVVAAAVVVVVLIWWLARLGTGQASGAPASARPAAEDRQSGAPQSGAPQLPVPAEPTRLSGGLAAEGREPTSVEQLVAAQIAAPTSSAPLFVILDFTGDCWVEASMDGSRRIAERRVQGESMQLEAEQVIELKIGDAGAVEIEVNGVPYRFEGQSRGMVRRLRIDLDLARALTEQ